MVPALINKFEYVEIDLAGNRIGDEGCKYLTQAQWSLLKQINLGLSLI